jgi:hypothetical protein
MGKIQVLATADEKSLHIIFGHNELYKMYVYVVESLIHGTECCVDLGNSHTTNYIIHVACCGCNA